MTTSSPVRRVAPLLIFVALVAAACGVSGPQDLGDLRVSVDNRSGAPIDLGTTIGGEGIAGDGSATIDPKGGGELISRLAPTWSITVAGKPFLSSAERPDLAVVAGQARRDLLVEVIVAPDGSVSLKSARFVQPQRSPDA